VRQFMGPGLIEMVGWGLKRADITSTSLVLQK